MRRALQTALLLWLSACAAARGAEWKPGTAECITRCGLHADTTFEGCRQLQRLETEALHAYHKHAQWDVAETCAALKGWTIEIHQRDQIDQQFCILGWIEPGWIMTTKPQCFAGYTHEGEKQIEIDTDNWRKSSLTHELIHAVEITRYQHAGHCGWGHRGLKAAIEEVTGEEDDTPSNGCDQVAGGR